MFPLAMFGLGVPELLIILAVVLLLFGGSRLAGHGCQSPALVTPNMSVRR